MWQVVQPFYEATRILFVRKENKNNDFIQQFILFQESATIIKSTTTHARSLNITTFLGLGFWTNSQP